jgi:hypothetical protein
LWKKNSIILSNSFFHCNHLSNSYPNCISATYNKILSIKRSSTGHHVTNLLLSQTTAMPLPFWSACLRGGAVNAHQNGYELEKCPLINFSLSLYPRCHPTDYNVKLKKEHQKKLSHNHWVVHSCFAKINQLMVWIE